MFPAGSVWRRTRRGGAGRGCRGPRRGLGAAPRQDGGQGGGTEGVRGRDRRRGGASAFLPGVRRLGSPGSPVVLPVGGGSVGPGARSPAGSRPLPAAAPESPAREGRSPPVPRGLVGAEAGPGSLVNLNIVNF